MNFLRTAIVMLLAASLLNPLPAGAVNLHNGYIVIVNESGHELRGSVGHIFAGVHHMQSLVIPPHSEAIANDCCYAAGSHYRVEMTSGQYRAHVDISPRYCNVRLIPHGFAKVAFHFADVPGMGTALIVQRVDNGCP